MLKRCLCKATDNCAWHSLRSKVRAGGSRAPNLETSRCADAGDEHIRNMSPELQQGERRTPVPGQAGSDLVLRVGHLALVPAQVGL